MKNYDIRTWLDYFAILGIKLLDTRDEQLADLHWDFKALWRIIKFYEEI